MRFRARKSCVTARGASPAIACPVWGAPPPRATGLTGVPPGKENQGGELAPPPRKQTHTCENITFRRTLYADGNYRLFSRAVSTSGATYLVTMACVCLVGCTYVCISRRDPHPPEIIGSQKFQNQNCFSSFWATFPGGPSPTKGKNFWHQIWLDTCSDWKKKIFKQIFFCKIF